MRSPSSKCLSNRADYYQATQTQDPDGGVQFTYPGVPTVQRLACSAQPGDPEEVIDDQNRITQEVPWRLFFTDNINAKARDKFVYTDQYGVVHILFVKAGRDGAGKGSYIGVNCIEKI